MSRLSLDGVCEEDVIVESTVDAVERKVELVEVANKWPPLGSRVEFGR